jgi:hypothetical protein
LSLGGGEFGGSGGSGGSGGAVIDTERAQRVSLSSSTAQNFEPQRRERVGSENVSSSKFFAW